MVMLARILAEDVAVVVGSVHKLDGYRGEKGYIKTSPAVIAGDQGTGFCREVGLNVIKGGKGDHNTWPAS